MLKALLSALCFFGVTACQRNGYHVEGGKVMLYYGLSDKRQVPEADAKTFRELSSTVGKDKSRVFVRFDILEGADPATFEVLSSSYFRDARNGYWDKRIASTDGRNFRIITNPHDSQSIMYARDSSKVYMRDALMPDADPATFEFVPMFNGYDLVRDKRHVYMSGHSKPLEDADGRTFTKIAPFYFRDAKGIWGLSLGRESNWIRMPLADPATFVAVGKFHAKDKSRVFRDVGVVEGADPATFVPPAGNGATAP
jgi:hypothetical protein